MHKVRLSSKGQVTLPKSIRAAHGWNPGTEVIIEDRADGVLLRELKAFAQTRLDEVAGSLRYRGKAKTVRQMDAAILSEVKSRHGRGRYG